MNFATWDIQGGFVVNFPDQTSLIPQADAAYFTFGGISDALGGATTADFRLTLLDGSQGPSFGDVNIRGGLDATSDFDIGEAIGNVVRTYPGHTIAGMKLYVGAQAPGDLGALAYLLEVDTGSGFVRLDSLAGVYPIDGYGLNPASDDSVGDLPYWTTEGVSGFWTAFEGCSIH